MAEFHIGDKVRVEHAPTSTEFVIAEISKGPDGLIYSGERTLWYKESQLDYALTDEQKEAQDELEHAVHGFFTASEIMFASAHKAQPLLPASLRAKIIAEGNKKYGSVLKLI